MKIDITEQAANWYKQELHLESETFVRFFPRYGGVGGIIPGFSLGLNKDLPRDIFTSIKVAGITFFIEEKDAWYFEDKKVVIINLDENNNEPVFTYE